MEQIYKFFGAVWVCHWIWLLPTIVKLDYIPNNPPKGHFSQNRFWVLFGGPKSTPSKKKVENRCFFNRKSTFLERERCYYEHFWRFLHGGPEFFCRILIFVIKMSFFVIFSHFCHNLAYFDKISVTRSFGFFMFWIVKKFQNFIYFWGA